MTKVEHQRAPERDPSRRHEFGLARMGETTLCPDWVTVCQHSNECFANQRCWAGRHPTGVAAGAQAGLSWCANDCSCTQPYWCSVHRACWARSHPVGSVPAVDPNHPDDVAVEAFAAAMSAKLARKRAEGYRGWEQLSPAQLWAMLKRHVEKGDPVDIGNIAMMVWHEERRAAPAAPDPTSQAGEMVEPASMRFMRRAVQEPVVYPRLMEERMLGHIAALVHEGKADPEWAAIARADMLRAFLSLERATQRREPAVLPEDGANG